MKLEISKFTQELNEVNSKLESTQIADKSPYFIRQAQLIRIIEILNEIEKVKIQIDENQEIIQKNEDIEFIELAKEDIDNLNNKLINFESELIDYISPPDPNDHRDIIIEIRAGAGGQEASLFAAELFRMYSRFVQLIGWNLSVISMTESEAGGVKEIIAKIKGKNVYRLLKIESGVHRVQRVPQTEVSGRLHTSAASVVVMPEVDDISIEINPKDLRIDVYRSSGHGGQSVNTTDSAVRITHFPTGIVVTCQDTKDQQKNKASAMSVLKSRLYQLELEKVNAEVSSKRKESIKSGDRSDKIKTYNFPQDRLTDHRIKHNWFGLDQIMNGEVKEILETTAKELKKVELEDEI